jgi:Tol biopolymer transport system component
LIYTGYALNRLDLDTLESEELISKEQLEQELGKDLYRTVFSPSPDGTMVLITASTSVSFEDMDTFEYYIASLDLTSLVPILDPGATAINWTWSPDGSRLLGDALMSNSKTIFVVNSDGSGLTELTKFPAIASPAWSADGSQVFWAALGVPMVMDADGTNQHPVGDVDQVVARMSFSPDGGKVAYLTDQSSLYIAQSDFSEGQLGSGRFDSETCQGRFPPGIMGWSVDGEYLIVRNYYCVVINRQLFPKAGDILVRTSDGERVNEGRFTESEPCGWSPDDKLVYIHKTDEGVRLVLVDVEAIDTGTAVEIAYSGTCPSWIP